MKDRGFYSIFYEESQQPCLFSHARTRVGEFIHTDEDIAHEKKGLFRRAAIKLGIHKSKTKRGSIK